VETRIGREGLRRLQRHPPANLQAYDLYLQGRELHGHSTEKDMLLARQYFDRAIAADPLYAPAHAWQAYVVQRGYTFDWGEPKGRAALDLALSFARRAVALEPDSSICLARLGLVLALVGQHAEAVQVAERGVRANPCDAAGRAAYGEVLSMSGDHATGAAELTTAMSLNPFHPPFWRATLGRALLLAGRHREALEALQRARIEAPDYLPCHSSLTVACIETGQVEAAREAAKDVLRLRPGFTVQRYNGTFGFSLMSDTDRFLSAFKAAGIP
jgi:adenylate cyclase